MSKAPIHLWSSTRIPDPSAPNPPTARPVAPSRSLAPFQPVGTPPPMSRRNGVGTKLLGRIGDPAIAPARVKLLWFTVFFVPVLPLHAYAVTGGASGYYFHGQLSLWGFLRRYRLRVFPYLLTAFIEAIFSAALVLTLAFLAYAVVAWLFGRL